MLPRFLLLLWIPLAVVACFAFTTVASERVEAEEALASWYGPGFSGLPTASGEPYDPWGYTAAHKTMPLGTELLVSYGGSSVAVTVNDRGPYVGARELDLSQGAAEALGLTEAGVDYVDYTWVGQYAAAPQYASTDQYSSVPTTTQYASVDQYSDDGSVSTVQYSTGSDAVLTEQYAGVEQYSNDTAEVTVEPEPVGTVAPTSSPAYSSGAAGGTLLVVRPGETLSEIALETGVSVDNLASRNAIDDPNVIYAGQVIYY